MTKINDLKIRLSSFLVLLAIIGWSSNSFAQWQTNGLDIYYNSGNVGIGVTSPTLSLDVDGVIGANGHFITTASNGAMILNSGPDDLGADAGIWFRSTLTLGVVDNYTDLGFWAANGNFRIGPGYANSPATEKLEVLGKIKSSGSNSALILESPDGTSWEITIDNSGFLSTSLAVKVPEIQNGNDINIYPNPTEDKLIIELKTNEIQDITTELYDISGKMVYMKSYKSSVINISLNDFDTGTYILKVKNENGNIIKTEKIVKK